MKEYEHIYYDSVKKKEVKYRVKISFGNEKLECCVNNILKAMSSKIELDIKNE